jgi:hypothetical protein
VLEWRSYRVADGELVGAATVEVGAGGRRGAAAASELTALAEAAAEVGRRAADELAAAHGALPEGR